MRKSSWAFVILSLLSSELSASRSPDPVDASPMPTIVPIQPIISKDLELPESDDPLLCGNPCGYESHLSSKVDSKPDQEWINERVATEEYYIEKDLELPESDDPLLCGNPCGYESHLSSKVDSKPDQGWINEQVATEEYYIKLAEEHITQAKLFLKCNAFWVVIGLLRKSPFFYSPLFYEPQKKLPILAAEPMLHKLPMDIQIPLYLLSVKALNGMNKFEDTVSLIEDNQLLNKLKEQKFDSTNFKLENELRSVMYEYKFACEKLSYINVETLSLQRKGSRTLSPASSFSSSPSRSAPNEVPITFSESDGRSVSQNTLTPVSSVKKSPNKDSISPDHSHLHVKSASSSNSSLYLSFSQAVNDAE